MKKFLAFSSIPLFMPLAVFLGGLWCDDDDDPTPPPLPPSPPPSPPHSSPPHPRKKKEKITRYWECFGFGATTHTGG